MLEMCIRDRSKLEAEFRVREEMTDALVARVSWVFGLSLIHI